MIYNFEFGQRRHLVLEAFEGEIVPHQVEIDEFCRLLLSRRTLERCDDEVSHRLGLFDRQSGDLFEIDESDFCSQK